MHASGAKAAQQGWRGCAAQERPRLCTVFLEGTHRRARLLRRRQLAEAEEAEEAAAAALADVDEQVTRVPPSDAGAPLVS